MEKNESEFDHFLRWSHSVDPMLLWAVLRPSIVPKVSLWDFLVDKARLSQKAIACEAITVLVEDLDLLLDQVVKFIHQVTYHEVDSQLEENLAQPYLYHGKYLKGILGRQPEAANVRVRKKSDIPNCNRLFNGTFDAVPKNLVQPSENEDSLEVRVGKESAADEEPRKKSKRKSRYIMSDNVMIGNDLKRISPSKFKCEKCLRLFKQKRSYLNHLSSTGRQCKGKPEPRWSKIYKGIYHCIHPDCLAESGGIVSKENSLALGSQQSYWKHIVDLHVMPEMYIFPCKMCGEKFPLQGMLSHHIKYNHEQQYVCRFCGKPSTSRLAGEKHERTHTGEKPHACDQCNYRCNSVSSLNSHRRKKHEGNPDARSHVCELCGKGFNTKSNLVNHIKTHSDIKHFTCPICGRQLKNDQCYRRHMASVHGHKFTCEMCGKDYSSQTGLRFHRREAHGVLI